MNDKNVDYIHPNLAADFGNLDANDLFADVVCDTDGSASWPKANLLLRDYDFQCPVRSLTAPVPFLRGNLLYEPQVQAIIECYKKERLSGNSKGFNDAYGKIQAVALCQDKGLVEELQQGNIEFERKKEILSKMRIIHVFAGQHRTIAIFWLLKDNPEWENDFLLVPVRLTIYHTDSAKEFFNGSIRKVILVRSKLSNESTGVAIGDNVWTSRCLLRDHIRILIPSWNSELDDLSRNWLVDEDVKYFVACIKKQEDPFDQLRINDTRNPKMRRVISICKILTMRAKDFNFAKNLIVSGIKTRNGDRQYFRDVAVWNSFYALKIESSNHVIFEARDSVVESFNSIIRSSNFNVSAATFEDIIKSKNKKKKPAVIQLKSKAGYDDGCYHQQSINQLQVPASNQILHLLTQENSFFQFLSNMVKANSDAIKGTSLRSTQTDKPDSPSDVIPYNESDSESSLNVDIDSVASRLRKRGTYSTTKQNSDFNDHTFSTRSSRSRKRQKREEVPIIIQSKAPTKSKKTDSHVGIISTNKICESLPSTDQINEPKKSDVVRLGPMLQIPEVRPLPFGNSDLNWKSTLLEVENISYTFARRQCLLHRGLLQFPCLEVRHAILRPSFRHLTSSFVSKELAHTIQASVIKDCEMLLCCIRVHRFYHRIVDLTEVIVNMGKLVQCSSCAHFIVYDELRPESNCTDEYELENVVTAMRQSNPPLITDFVRMNILSSKKVNLFLLFVSKDSQGNIHLHDSVFWGMKNRIQWLSKSINDRTCNIYLSMDKISFGCFPFLSFLYCVLYEIFLVHPQVMTLFGGRSAHAFQEASASKKKYKSAVVLLNCCIDFSLIIYHFTSITNVFSFETYFEPRYVFDKAFLFEFENNAVQNNEMLKRIVFHTLRVKKSVVEDKTFSELPVYDELREEEFIESTSDNILFDVDQDKLEWFQY